MDAPAIDFFSKPQEIEFEGTLWKLRQPDTDEEGMFQVYLEQEAYNAIERRTYQSEEQKAVDRERLNDACTIGKYDYGGPLCVEAMGMPKGIAAMVNIVCMKQGMTLAIAKRMVNRKLSEIAATVCSQSEGMDQENLRGICLRLGLPADFVSVKATETKTDASTETPATSTEAPAG